MRVNKSSEALECWGPLFELPADHPLHLMALGLQALMHDDYGACHQHLTQGIQANQRMESLNDDMRSILGELEKRGLTPAAELAHPTLGGYGPQ